ncbi:FMN-binding negative transcriptional regulator [Brevundimonas sp. 2R-24]|uniref:FMN-binding negative transcriptional regulator n=1 Tax=Peiella sedimenti TaxID=3061083 RepID=A0ABT8SI16_9CAUL|nr:FMN-binding negative transcriptional regulator [Caulobacteraceae bacterium XZ-24]
MWTPPLFREDDPQIIDALIDQARLALLVTQGAEGLNATHLPMVRDGARGVLLGHIARPNPHWRDGATEALVVLPGPEAYVSPNWYPSKAVDGRQVPTWNYEAVHVRGRIEWFDDRDRLTEVLERLSDRHEAGQAEPWRLSDAPADYIDRLMRGIVGVEVRLEHVEAKRKLSQQKSPADRAGTIAGLEGTGDPRDRLLAARMREVD